MEQTRVERINNFLKTLSLDKVKQVASKHKNGTLTIVELERLVIFKDLPLEKKEKEELLIDNYTSIESRLAGLQKGNFFNEVIMIGVLFLQDEKDDNALYDSKLKIEKDSFKRILYFLCVALYDTRQFILCQPYIDLMQKLVIAFPSDVNPPQGVLDKIGYQVYSNL